MPLEPPDLRLVTDPGDADKPSFSKRVVDANLVEALRAVGDREGSNGVVVLRIPPENFNETELKELLTKKALQMVPIAPTDAELVTNKGDLAAYFSRTYDYDYLLVVVPMEGLSLILGEYPFYSPEVYVFDSKNFPPRKRSGEQYEGKRIWEIIDMVRAECEKAKDGKRKTEFLRQKLGAVEESIALMRDIIYGPERPEEEKVPLFMKLWKLKLRFAAEVNAVILDFLKEYGDRVALKERERGGPPPPPLVSGGEFVLVQSPGEIAMRRRLRAGKFDLMRRFVE